MRLTINIECSNETEVYRVSKALAGMTETQPAGVPLDVAYEKHMEVRTVRPEVQPVEEYNHIPAPPLNPASPLLPVEEPHVNDLDGPPLAPPAPPNLDADDGFPPPPPGAGPALDSAGIPWDARIHAGSKTTVAAGTWKLKPGADKALVAAVIAELKGVQAIPVPPAPAPAHEAVLSNVIPFPPIGGAPPAPPAAPTCPPDFASFIKEITGRITLGQLTPDQVNATCQTLGLDKCNLLAGRPDLIPAVWAALPAA